MKSQEFLTFKETVNRDEFKTYYQSNGFRDTLAYYGLSNGNLRELVKEWELYLSQEQRDKLKKETWAKKDSSKENQLKKYMEKIPKEDLNTYYIVENHSQRETCSHFDISLKWLITLIDTYDIHKEYSDRNKISQGVKLEKYGDPSYNNREKAKKTCLEKYGVDNIFKDRKTMVESYIKSLGVCHPMLDENVKNKVISQLDYKANWDKSHETMFKKYGYYNVSKNPEIKQKIAESVKKTFIEKYGAECYWQTENAIKSLSSTDSKPNIYFKELLDKYQIEYDREFPIGNYRYDFKVGNTLIEINPTPTHNSTWGIFGEAKDKNYHFNKTQAAINNGYRCINVWDWDDIEKICALLKQRSRIYARDCIIKEISLKESKKYLNDNHLQGSTNSTIQIGLFDKENELVSLMTFGNPRYNKNVQYELIRYCATKDIVGGAEKLFKYFINTYSPQSIVSYCDLSKFSGSTYDKLKFTKKSISICKHWYSISKKNHITDNLLRQRGFDQLLGEEYGCYGKGTSNEELMLAHGFVEIYDCGQATFLWDNSTIC